MKILNLGLESISFQSGKFYKDLTKIIEDARLQGYTKDNALEVGKKIALCTAEYTNIQTTVEFIENFNNACIIPSYFTPESVMVSGPRACVIKDYYDDLSSLGRGKKIEGWVNAHASKVGGEFAKLVHKTYYDRDFIFGRKQFSAEGAAAVILHEIGHGFTFFQFIADTAMLNLVLQQTYQELTEARDSSGVQMVIERARKKLELDQPSDWVKEVGKDKDANVIINILAGEAVMMRRDSDNKAIYTQDSSEEMAEIFCLRHGGARGLIEVRQYFGERRGLENANFGILTGASMAAMGALLTALAGPLGISLLASGLFYFIAGNAAAANMPEFTKLSQTIGKARNQLVEQIKTVKLPAKELEEVIASIDYAIRVMKETPDEKLPFAVAFWDFFRTGKRDTRAWREYTDKLETMATNELFIRAARIGLKG